MSPIPSRYDDTEVTLVVSVPPGIKRRLELRRERLERRRRALFKAWWNDSYATYLTIR